MAKEERIYNYRLSRARRVVENAFGILAQRFAIFLSTMQHEPKTVREIIKTCLLLHNLMRTRYPGLQNQDLDRPENNEDAFTAGEWRLHANLVDNDQVAGPNAATREAKIQRNTLKHWCNSPAGAVEWQDRMI